MQSPSLTCMRLKVLCTLNKNNTAKKPVQGWEERGISLSIKCYQNTQTNHIYITLSLSLSHTHMLINPNPRG